MFINIIRQRLKNNCRKSVRPNQGVVDQADTLGGGSKEDEDKEWRAREREMYCMFVVIRFFCNMRMIPCKLGSNCKSRYTK